MEEILGWHHSVTEIGNIQVRIKSEFVKNSKKKLKKLSDPKTPADTKDINKWDERTKAIVAEITDPQTLIDFEAEKNNPVLFRHDYYQHLSKITGIGVEEAAVRDCEMLDDNRVGIRCIYRLFKDGEEIKKEYHRDWIIPGQITDKYGVMAKAVAKAVHTPEIIEAYLAKLAEQALEATKL